MSLLTCFAFRQAAQPSICLPMQQSSGHLLAGRWLHCQGASALCYLCETNAVYLLPLSCRAAPAIQQQLLCLESALLLLLIFQSAWGLSFSLHDLETILQSATSNDLQPCCREVLVMVMRKHQRYFPVFAEGSNSQLLPHFITVANSPVDDNVIQVSLCCILCLQQ